MPDTRWMPDSKRICGTGWPVVNGHCATEFVAKGRKPLGLAACVITCMVAALSTSSLFAQAPRDVSSSPATALKPEVRFVQVSEVNIYAGPSEDFYPTQRMKRGDAVEVFQKTGDGWLAIRPPQGSFSWLPAAQGLLLPGGRVVEVTDKAAVAWIGTALGTAKQYRWQVQLNRGEQLSILGEQTIQDEAAGTKSLWYKIAPPAGEFRWIREQATGSENPALGQSNSEEPSGESSSETGELAAATATEDDGDGQVQPASAESAIGTGVRKPTKANVRGTNGNQRVVHNHQHPADPWESWHAMEFKNGSFSFPGVARMFGLQPKQSSSPTDQYDPFDLRNNARPLNSPRADRSSSGESLAGGSRSIVDAGDDEPGASLASRESRGWRDPRALRGARQRGSGANLEPSDALPLESSEALTANGTMDSVVSPAIVTDDTPIGSAVVQAGSELPIASANDSDDASWYGIRQSPQANAAQPPMTLTQADLAEVQIRLSEMVAGPEHTWNLAPLADRTRYLIEHGKTAIERGEARLLLDRIEAFAKVARQSSQLGLSAPIASAATSSTVQSNRPTASLASTAARWVAPLGVSPGADTLPPDNTPGAPRFDATGWVVPVHTSARDMPTHALTNDSGKIIVYLTPAPGVNLSRYQSQAVGVYGLRGYLPQLRANHIQVQRAVRLQ